MGFDAAFRVSHSCQMVTAHRPGKSLRLKAWPRPSDVPADYGRQFSATGVANGSKITGIDPAAPKYPVFGRSVIPDGAGLSHLRPVALCAEWDEGM